MNQSPSASRLLRSVVRTKETGQIMSEPGHVLHQDLNGTVVGVIEAGDNRHYIFTAVSPVIGSIYLKEGSSYTLLVTANFSFSTLREHIVKGVAFIRSQCEESIYWCDDKNQDRYFVPSRPELFQSSPGIWDIDKFVLQPGIIDPSDVVVQETETSGTLDFGAYFLVLEYLDASGTTLGKSSPYGPTYIGPQFNLENISSDLGGEDGSTSSLNVNITGIDPTVAFIRPNWIVYRSGDGISRIGFSEGRTIRVSFGSIQFTTSELSTAQGGVFEDTSSLLQPNVIYDRSIDLEIFGNRILRLAPRTAADDYVALQHAASAIKVNFEAKALALDDETKSESPGEVVPLAIRFLRASGTYTDAYHIPAETSPFKEQVLGGDPVLFPGTTNHRWRSEDVATIPAQPTDSTPVVGELGLYRPGGVYKTPECYLADGVDYWGNDFAGNPIAGTDIRFHRIPTRQTVPIVNADNTLKTVIGLRFSNITLPPGMIGYEILAGFGEEVVVDSGYMTNHYRDDEQRRGSLFPILNQSIVSEETWGNSITPRDEAQVWEADGVPDGTQFWSADMFYLDNEQVGDVVEYSGRYTLYSPEGEVPGLTMFYVHDRGGFFSGDLPYNNLLQFQAIYRPSKPGCFSPLSSTAFVNRELARYIPKMTRIQNEGSLYVNRSFSNPIKYFPLIHPDQGRPTYTVLYTKRTPYINLPSVRYEKRSSLQSASTVSLYTGTRYVLPLDFHNMVQLSNRDPTVDLLTSASEANPFDVIGKLKVVKKLRRSLIRNTIGQFTNNTIETVHEYFERFVVDTRVNLAQLPTLGGENVQFKPIRQNLSTGRQLENLYFDFSVNRFAEPFDNGNSKLQLRDSIVPEPYLYNLDLAVRNNLVESFSLPDFFDYCSDCNGAYTKRIIYSQPQGQDGGANALRSFLPNSFVDVESSHPLIAIDDWAGTLVARSTTAAFFFRASPEILNVGDLSAFIGKGDFLSVPPQRSTSDNVGIYGQQTRDASAKVAPGICWWDQRSTKLMLYNGSLVDLSERGMSSYMDLLLEPVVSGKNFNSNHVTISYDPQFDRILFSLRKFVPVSPPIVVANETQATLLNTLYILTDTNEYFYQDISGPQQIDQTFINPDVFVNRSATLSYSFRDTPSWFSFHQYHPSFAFYSQDEFFMVPSWVDTSKVFLQSLTAPSMNYFGVFQGSMLIEVKLPLDAREMVSSIGFLTRVYDRGGQIGVLDRGRKLVNRTFDFATVHNDIVGSDKFALSVKQNYYDQVVALSQSTRKLPMIGEMYMLSGIFNFSPKNAPTILRSDWALLQTLYSPTALGYEEYTIAPADPSGRRNYWESDYTRGTFAHVLFEFNGPQYIYVDKFILNTQDTKW